MARKPEIQYIERFFIPGSAAPQLQPKRGASKTTLPKAQPEKVVRIQVDPVALVGLVVAVVMLALMVVGVFQFNAASQENQQMHDYLMTLRNTNVELEYQYRTGMDFASIEEQALALGMIPREEAPRVTIQVTVPQPEPERTWWDDFVWFLEGLFA